MMGCGLELLERRKRTAQELFFDVDPCYHQYNHNEFADDHCQSRIQYERTRRHDDFGEVNGMTNKTVRAADNQAACFGPEREVHAEGGHGVYTQGDSGKRHD